MSCAELKWLKELRGAIEWPSAVTWQALAARVGKDFPKALRAVLAHLNVTLCVRCMRCLFEGVVLHGDTQQVSDVVEMLVDAGAGSLGMLLDTVLVAADRTRRPELKLAIALRLAKTTPKVAPWLVAMGHRALGEQVSRRRLRRVSFDERLDVAPLPTPDEARLPEALDRGDYPAAFRQLARQGLCDVGRLLEVVDQLTEAQAQALCGYCAEFDKYGRSEKGSLRRLEGAEVAVVDVLTEDATDAYAAVRLEAMFWNGKTEVVAEERLAEGELKEGSRVLVSMADYMQIKNTLEANRAPLQVPRETFYQIALVAGWAPIDPKNNVNEWIVLSYPDDTIVSIPTSANLSLLYPRIQDLVLCFLACTRQWKEAHYYKWQWCLYNRELDKTQARILHEYLPSTLDQDIFDHLRSYPDLTMKEKPVADDQDSVVA
ncbi:hypothetical protein DIPPA_14507 [Diplonema papillatum]|nr:hypothetical protein DIPPA_14507 [Diplonema papillatum]